MISSNEISVAAAQILAGGLVAFPTETVYGLGADATQDFAVAKIYAAKGRPQFNPLIAHVHEANAAYILGEFSNQAVKLAEKFWPGPLTIVVPRASNCPVSLLASAGLPSLALRVPKHEVALRLLKAVGRPVVAPSANPSGRISPTTADHVRQHLSVNVLDGGSCAVGVESTVISFLEQEPLLLRPGGLARGEIEDALSQKLGSPTGSEFHAPGQLESHYAPNAKMRLNVLEPEAGEAYLAFGESPHQFNLSATGNLVEAAANLFRLLHEIDTTSPHMIAVSPIPNVGLGEAINDRLKRAAAPKGWGCYIGHLMP
jgi:L-threonylcarbamoyladenylate synthase